MSAEKHFFCQHCPAEMTMDFNNTQMANGQRKKLLTLVWFQEFKWVFPFFNTSVGQLVFAVLGRQLACYPSGGCHFEENLIQPLLP